MLPKSLEASNRGWRLLPQRPGGTIPMHGPARPPASPAARARTPPPAAARPQEAIVRGTALAGLSAALLSAGSANAAMEVANIAASSDNRFGTIALLAVPVLGVRTPRALPPAASTAPFLAAATITPLACA